MRYRLILILLVTAFFTAFSGPIFARPQEGKDVSPLHMEVEAGFDGYLKAGAVVPVKVKLVNTGPDIEGDIVVKIPAENREELTEHVVKVVLPQGSTKKIAMALSVPGAIRDFEVSFVTDGRALARKSPSLYHGDPVLIAVLAADPGGLDYLAAFNLPTQLGRFIKVLRWTAENVPGEVAVLNSLDVLVINDFPTRSLKEEQWQAIENWVRGGKLLVIGTGPGWKRTVEGIPRSLQVVNIEGTQEVPAIPALEKYTGQEIPEGKYVMAKGSLVEGAGVVVGEGDIPVLAWKQVGKGNVVYSALDLTLEPLASWKGNRFLWSSIYSMFGPPNLTLKQIARPVYPYGLFSALSQLPFNVIPPFWLVIVLLLVYIGILGFGNYFVLNKLDKRDLAWVTIPLLVILFSSGVYLVGIKGKGRDIIATYIHVVELDTGQARTYTGIFAPTKSSYRIQLPGKVAVHAGRNYDRPYYGGNISNVPVTTRVHYGEKTEVEMLNMNMWSLRSFYFDHNFNAGRIESNLRTENGRITGEITNRTGYNLRDVLVFTSQGQYQAISSLKDGEKVQVDIPVIPYASQGGRPFFHQMLDSLQPQGSGRSERDRQINRELQILEGTYGWEGEQSSPGVVMVGFSEDPLTGVKVNGRTPKEYHLNMFTTGLEINVEGSGGNLPTGIVEMKPVYTDARRTGMERPGVIGFSEGSMIFQAVIPQQVVPMVEELRFSAGLSNNYTAAQIYNWGKNTWDDFRLTGSGIKAEEYLSPEGLVRVKLSNNSDQYTWINNLSVGVEGGRQANAESGESP
ncbi:hypothetical protein [Calderihabitans maritimus]|uniref:Uncharacterized protein n=1 Tax=Calderihabitans maritimus TaxID=1246530 RepID=A0A1Z5HRC9_9FIRM|nr:hypothetical protein [Calderihabitans maritimus]GAW91875.1 hypothetical protein Swol_1724 [Calderihabitans maritimus]